MARSPNYSLRAQAFAPRFNVSADFTFSDGWMAGFKSRRNIRSVVLHGGASQEDGDVAHAEHSSDINDTVSIVMIYL